MFLTNEWYWFPEAIDKLTCKKIKDLGKNNFESGIVNTRKTATEEERATGMIPKWEKSDNIRISEICFLKEHQWIIELLWPFMEEANQRTGWNFNVDSCESPQLTKYRKGGHYAFHRDGMSDHLSLHKYPGLNTEPKIRKLSMTLTLNDSYDGGNLEFMSHGNQNCKIHTEEEFRKPGTLIFFPSFLEHRVAPITKGTRYSVVLWFLGPAFV